MEKQSASDFAEWCHQRHLEHCGYILCAIGQDPKKLSEWYFSGQYSGERLAKANYWRENAPRVFDCQGLADGYLTEKLGKKVDVRARNNYADWCGVKGSGMIPAEYRMPGAAVFKRGSYVHHVGFLYAPIEADRSEGDWYVVEAKGVMHGVVQTKLLSGGWNLWGLMTEYFDYGQETPQAASVLRRGMSGNAVASLQSDLIALGYSCGKWGADGDFGAATEKALMAYQHDKGLAVDGSAGEETLRALNDDLKESDEAQEADAPPARGTVRIGPGNWYLRDQPGTQGAKRALAKEGTLLPASGEVTEGWLGVLLDRENAWVSRKGAKTV